MNECPMCTRWVQEADLRIVEFDTCFATLNRDQFFPGYTLLFSKEHVTELFHLDERVRNTMMDEVSRMSRALFSAFQPTKINYELLGNMVPHIHWHLIPRFKTDHLWPRPIWAEPHEEHLLTPEQYREVITKIRSNLT